MNEQIPSVEAAWMVVFDDALGVTFRKADGSWTYAQELGERMNRGACAGLVKRLSGSRMFCVNFSENQPALTSVSTD